MSFSRFLRRVNVRVLRFEHVFEIICQRAIAATTTVYTHTNIDNNFTGIRNHQDVRKLLCVQTLSQISTCPSDELLLIRPDDT